MKMRLWKVWGIIVCLVPSMAWAGQGLFLYVSSFAPGARVSIDSSQCVKLPAKIVPNQTIYLEAKNSPLSCLFTASKLNFSVWQQAASAEKMASFSLVISNTGSKITTSYRNSKFTSQLQFYPRFGMSWSQDFVITSVSGLKPSDWMASLDPKLKLKQLSVAGTHDSGTSSISGQSDLTSDAAWQVSNLYKYGTLVARQLIANWARTQTLSVEQQLNAGIRYFDLRLCGNAALSEIVTCHALAGEKLVDVVNAVRKFNLAHPREIIILDFNHWYARDGQLAAMRRTVADYLLQQFDEHIALRSSYSLNSSLAQLWHDERSILLFSNNIDEQPGWWLSRQVTGVAGLDKCQGVDLCSMWPAADNADKLIKSLDGALAHLRKLEPNYWFVVQTQLTATSAMIKDSVLLKKSKPRNLRELTGSYKDDVLQYLKKPATLAGLHGLILIEDFSIGLDLLELAKQQSNLSQLPGY